MQPDQIRMYNVFLNLGISHPHNPFEEEFGSSSGSGQGVWTELSEDVASNLANTVVSLASFSEGDYTHHRPWIFPSNPR
jgi:hypothetical protein